MLPPGSGRKAGRGDGARPPGVVPSTPYYVEALTQMHAVEEIRAEARRCLQPLSARLSATLGLLIHQPLPKPVAFVEFQVFTDPGSYAVGFPVRAFFLDANNTEYFEDDDGEAVYPCSVDPSLLDVPTTIGLHTWDAWESRYPDLDTCTVVAESVIPWFYSCWNNAGGARFSLPAFISVHDDQHTFDLINGVWLDVSSGDVLGAAIGSGGSA